MTIALALAVNLPACGRAPSQQYDDTELRNRLSIAESSLTNLQAVARQKDEQATLDENLVLTPDDHSFAAAKTSVGSIAFAIQGVEAYADGSRVTLKVGNLTAGTITKLTGKISAGKATKQFELATLLPGYWSVRTVDLASVPPNQLHFINITEVEAANVSLNGFSP